MADSQEIKAIVEGVIGKVFDKRIAELRKELHRGVGESLDSRVSELQLDVETGVAEMFGARVQEIRTQVSRGAGSALDRQLGDLRNDVEKGVADVINARAQEIKSHVDQGMGEVLGARAADLRREIESTVSGIFHQRVGELQKDIEHAVTEATSQRLGALRQELEKAIENNAEKRVLELKKDVERVVSEKAEHRVEELRKDVHRMVMEVADKRAGSLKQDIEKIVGETTERSLGILRKDVERVVGEVAERRVSSIRKDVEKTVAEAGQQRVQELRDDLVHRVTSELEPALKGKPAEAPVSALLDSAIHSIQDSTSQTDILRALLDGAAHFSSRVALLVIKGDAAAGWQARGFDDNNGIKKLSVDAGSGLTGKALQSHGTASGAAKDFDSKFISQMGEPKTGKAWVIPLLVRDKIPAVLYADVGTHSDGESDTPALQLLTRTAGLWLEVLTLRKSAAATVEAPPEAPAEEHAPAAHAAAAAAAAAEPAHVAAPSAADDEIHKKAKRFAKLLVDEIKLYNQAKVNEGRQHHDLYNRLKEDIEKSRASYDKRYGNTPAASGDYFNQEVIKVLAENDAALMGSGFPR
jgi:hypothetical protein